MSRNGSGTYSLPAGNPVVTGTTVSTTWANTTLSDIATAITGSIAADGQTPVTANIPMNSKKLTGLAAGTTSGDALSYGQAAMGPISGTTGTFSGDISSGGNASITGNTTAKGVALVVVKPTTTSRTSTTTLADDPVLVLALPVGTWSLDGLLMFYGTTSGTQSMKIQLAFSGTSTSAGANLTGFVNAAAVNGSLSITAFSTNIMPNPISTNSASPDYMRVNGFITVSVAGNLSIQWAQNASSGNATNVALGSYLSCTKLA